MLKLLGVVFGLLFLLVLLKLLAPRRTHVQRAEEGGLGAVISDGERGRGGPLRDPRAQTAQHALSIASLSPCALCALLLLPAQLGRAQEK